MTRDSADRVDTVATVLRGNTDASPNVEGATPGTAVDLIEHG